MVGDCSLSLIEFVRCSASVQDRSTDSERTLDQLEIVSVLVREMCAPLDVQT